MVTVRRIGFAISADIRHMSIINCLLPRKAMKSSQLQAIKREVRKVFEVFNRSGEKFTVYGVVRNDGERETTDFLIFDGYRFVWKESEFFIPTDGGAE